MVGCKVMAHASDEAEMEALVGAISGAILSAVQRRYSVSRRNAWTFVVLSPSMPRCSKD